MFLNNFVSFWKKEGQNYVLIISPFIQSKSIDSKCGIIYEKARCQDLSYFNKNLKQVKLYF